MSTKPYVFRIVYRKSNVVKTHPERYAELSVASQVLRQLCIECPASRPFLRIVRDNDKN